MRTRILVGVLGGLLIGHGAHVLLCRAQDSGVRAVWIDDFPAIRSKQHGYKYIDVHRFDDGPNTCYVTTDQDGIGISCVVRSGGAR